MFKFIRSLYWNWRLGRVQKQLEARLRSECEVVEINIGDLTLTSFNPGKKQTGSVNGQEIAFCFSTWDGEAFFPFWGGRLQISLSIGAARPQHHQLEAIRLILNYPKCIREEVESALIEYYRSDVYHPEAVDFDGNSLPKPTDHKRIKQMLHGPTIDPESSEEEGAPLSFTLHFGCGWDVEHGVSVRLDNWKLVAVGG